MLQGIDLYGQVKVPLLSIEKLIELLERVESGDQLARQQIVLANLGLVRKSTHYHIRNTAPLGTDPMDLFQEGLLGLDRAIDKFDYRKGYTFATYAANWINQAIVSFIHKNSATVTTRERSHGARLVSQIREDFQLRFGRQPTPEEICRIGRITPSAFERYSSQPIVVTAYEPSIGNDVPLEELHIESWSDTSEIDAVLDLCMAIEDLNLTPIERQVMEMKFGFGEYMPNSISDISRAVHRSTRQVENILKQIVDRLRSHDLIAISAED